MLVACIALVAFSCQNAEKTKELDNSYKGEITVSADETFSSIIEQQSNAYMNEYPETRIKVRSRTESECFQDVQDSSRVILVTRKPNENDLADYAVRKIVPRVQEVAANAIALIVPVNSTLDEITISRLTALLAGKTTDPTLLIFDNSVTGVYRYMLEKTGVTIPSKNIFSVKNGDELITEVAGKDNAIGFADYSLFSDLDDSSTRERLKHVKILAIAADSVIGTELVYIKPGISSIAYGKYPLIRYIYAITLESRSGLGNAFIGYMLNDKGQAIFRMAGLSPYYLTGIIKEVQTKND